MPSRLGACATLAIAAVGLFAGGCGSSEVGGAAVPPSNAPSAAAPATTEEAPPPLDCGLTAIYYRGHTYLSVSVEVSPLEGASLGSALWVGCGVSEERVIELAEVVGVSPDLAVARKGHEDTVLIRQGADLDRLPAKLGRLLSAPTCQSSDEPIRLSGTWLGILGADGNTELDLETPYDVNMHVQDSSAKRYERAYLTVRFPVEREHPLSRTDIVESLWGGGGTISVTVRCARAEFVAEQIRAN
jgi:hypothetical protein